MPNLTVTLALQAQVADKTRRGRRHPEFGKFSRIEDATDGSRKYQAPSGAMMRIRHGGKKSIVSVHPTGDKKHGKRWSFGNKFDAEKFRVQKFGK